MPWTRGAQLLTGVLALTQSRSQRPRAREELLDPLPPRQGVHAAQGGRSLEGRPPWFEPGVRVTGASSRTLRGPEEPNTDRLVPAHLERQHLQLVDRVGFEELRRHAEAVHEVSGNQ